MVFGYPLNTLAGNRDQLQQCLEQIFPTVNRRMSAAIPVWRYWKRAADRSFEQALQMVKATVLQFVQEARVSMENNSLSSKENSNFLRALLAEEGAGFSEEEIYSAVFTLLLAGEDTTSNALAWAFCLLAQHPEIVRKVRAEAEQVIGDSDTVPDADRHQQLIYANAVAQEVIRLKPPSPQLILQTASNLEINGLLLPRETNVFLLNRMPQCDAAYFTDPHKFLPERWLANRCPMDFQHQPDQIRAFGGGPRFCPGKHLALHEMVIVISTICRYFDLELLEDSASITEEFSFTMHPSRFHLCFR